MMDLGVITPDLAVHLMEVEPAYLAEQHATVRSLQLGDLLVPQPSLPRSMVAQSYPQLTLIGSWLLVSEGPVDPNEFSPEPLQIFDTLSDLDTSPQRFGLGTSVQDPGRTISLSLDPRFRSQRCLSSRDVFYDLLSNLR